MALSLLPESVIEERPSWTLAVNRNQDRLGKTMLVLQRHCDAVIDIAPDEWALLRDELRRIVPALDRLFHPDQFNSALLMAESDLDAGPQAAGIRPRCPGVGRYLYGASVMTEGIEEVDQHIRHVAAALGLSIIGPFAHGTFGALAVATADGEELVLKAQPDPTLEPVWATGAAMAARHERGYPNPRILRVGSTGAAVWSLQERLAGEVLRRLTLTHAAQLITLAGRHDIDSGRCRPWREDAIAAAREWLDSTPIDPTHARVSTATSTTATPWSMGTRSLACSTGKSPVPATGGSTW